MNGTSEAIERELAAGPIEQDLGVREGHVVARRLDDLPSAPNAQAGAARSLGSRIRLRLQAPGRRQHPPGRDLTA